MAHDVAGDRLQPVVSGDDVVLPAQFPFEFLLLIAIEIGGFDHRVGVVVEIGVDQLQPRRAVLIGQSPHIAAITQQLGDPELLDEGEHVAVGAAAGMALIPLGRGYDSSGLERLGDLFVEVGAVGDD